MEAMSANPWLVANIQDFSFINCPQCNFKTKEENKFHIHAENNHPQSFVFFASDDKDERSKIDKNHKTLEELMYTESDVEGQ